ncbi:MAG: hypothetical protein IJZ90_03730 [Clostridia bacterium]|nr:hypothetical protein [Clostridia bacterium]
MAAEKVKGKLILNILTPAESAAPIECDSVHLWISDDEKGRGGGSYGIRWRHVDAIISVAEGDVIAFSEEKEIYRVKTSSGLAVVESDTVTVMADAIIQKY